MREITTTAIPKTTTAMAMYGASRCANVFCARILKSFTSCGHGFGGAR